MINPFYYGNEVSGDDFCNRISELSELKKDVESGLNVLLYAPRRFGKTSLLKKLQHQLEASYAKVIYFDFFSVSSNDEFVQKYFDVSAKAFESNSDKILNLFKNILKIRPSMTIKANQSGKLSYGLTFSRSEAASTLEDVLNIPFLYAKKMNQKVVVIFDEFQEIEQFELEKKFRSIIQSHSRDVSYIFCGSKKSIINAMFNDINRAFYKSVKRLHINEISLCDWILFANPKFKSNHKTISDKQIEYIFTITAGFPYYMQQLLFMVWDICEDKVTDEIIAQALKLMLEREYDLYSLIWTNLTPNQKKAIKYIINNNGYNLYANETMQEASFTASTLKSALEALIKKDVCDKQNDQFYLSDPFMKEWIKTYSF